MTTGRAGAVVAALLAVSPLHAEPPHDAIGRITYGAHVPGAAICTGTLVAADLVLTAAHCVRRTANPASLLFQAGFRDGQAAATYRGRAVILAEGAAEGFDRDVALVAVEPAPQGPEPVAVGQRQGRRLTLVGYRRDAAESPLRDDLCMLVVDHPPRLWLGCPVSSGLSGAPLLERQGDGWRVVAVMVGGASGPFRSLAVRLPDDIAARIAGP